MRHSCDSGQCGDVNLIKILSPRPSGMNVWSCEHGHNSLISNLGGVLEPASRLAGMVHTSPPSGQRLRVGCPPIFMDEASTADSEERCCGNLSAPVAGKNYSSVMDHDRRASNLNSRCGCLFKLGMQAFTPATSPESCQWCPDDGVDVELTFTPWQTRPDKGNHRAVVGGIKDVHKYAWSAGLSSLNASALE